MELPTLPKCKKHGSLFMIHYDDSTMYCKACVSWYQVWDGNKCLFLSNSQDEYETFKLENKK